MMIRAVRYLAAMIVLIYGFAKINGSQFTILDSELDKPMGQVSGFWLTWYFFGYSPVYRVLLGMAEITGAILLTIPRTTLAGACLLVAVLANVVAIDLCFQIDPGATLIACMLLAAMLWLISKRWAELRAVLYSALSPTVGQGGAAPQQWFRWSLRTAMIAAAFSFTYWTANYNNRLPTPMDGVWNVVQVRPPELAAQLPATIFFEHNRASMTVFKAHDGSYATHHFEIEERTRSIRLWERWLTKGNPIFTGTYRLENSVMHMTGALGDGNHVEIGLKRRSDPVISRSNKPKESVPSQ